MTLRCEQTARNRTSVDRGRGTASMRALAPGWRRRRRGGGGGGGSVLVARALQTSLPAPLQLQMLEPWLPQLVQQQQQQQQQQARGRGRRLDKLTTSLDGLGARRRQAIQSAPDTGARWRGLSRGFHSLAAREAWEKRMVASRLRTDGRALAEHGDASAAAIAEAPFLYSVDPMFARLKIRTLEDTAAHSPGASCVEVVYPLSGDDMLRTAVSDVGSWSTFRLSKFYEAVDALTADVAYKHCGGVDGDLTLVTAGHYFSRKLKKTDIARDVVLRAYVTAAGAGGSSSLEVRLDATQVDAATGAEEMVNVCHTVMVALDKRTMRPTKGKVPVLALEDGGAEATAQAQERAELARLHADVRKAHAGTALQLRQSKISLPPTPDEMAQVHQLHREIVQQQESPAPRPPKPHSVRDLTFRSSFVTFPENKNVHGKTFGGYVMSQGYNLALYTAKVFAQGGALVPLGIDEAVFLQPISPQGDLVTFTARLVHATEHTCRVFVTAEVRDPADAGRLPLRSNRLVFVFAHQAAKGKNRRNAVAPFSYSEILSHVEAVRRCQQEGPSEEFARNLLLEIQHNLDPATTAA